MGGFHPVFTRLTTRYHPIIAEFSDGLRPPRSEPVDRGPASAAHRIVSAAIPHRADGRFCQLCYDVLFNFVGTEFRMPSIKIGDKLCSFEGKKSILQVALENGIEIPHYCYHPGLTVVASCRICLAEIATPNPKTGELQRVPKLVPTCQQPAVDGAEVYLDSDLTRANQKAVMEYLLINHPLDCPVCDQAGECYLQDYSYKYGRAYSRFEETKVKNPKKDVGPHVLLYADRCIMCTRCVRFTREVTGTGELCVTGRGNKEEIDVFPGKALDNELSANVVDICPVGALLDKEFLFEQRVWYLTSTPSIDGITASGDNIWVDHNQGKVWRIKPRTNLEVNKWWISDEIRYGWKFVHDENRLRSPSVRISGKTADCDWAVAYRELLAGFQGASARGRRVAAMLSPMLTCEDAYLLARVARELDPQAILAVGPVPRFGEDKAFPGGYTVRAEKAPNARGVRRMIEHVVGKGEALDFDGFVKLLNNDDARGHNLGAVLLTGNYPSGWVTTRLGEALADRFVALIDTLPNGLSHRAQVVLPGATWVEKTGTFQNCNDRLQGFEQAIAPLEGCKAEAQIALDLLAAIRGERPQRYNREQIHPQLDAGFTTDLHTPPKDAVLEPEMAFAEF